MWTTILVGDVWQGELVNRRKDNSLYIEEQTITPVLNAAGEATHFVAVKHDITLRKQHERELEAVAAVSSALRDAATRSEMLPVVLDQVQGLFAADGAIIEFVDQQRRKLQIEHACGIWAPLCGACVDTSAGINAQVFAAGTPYLTNDAQSQPEFVFPELLGPVRAIAAVPLIAQGNHYRNIGRRQPAAADGA